MIERGRGTEPMPAVITSAWQAADGDLGFAFMNISDEQQEFEYELNLPDYFQDCQMPTEMKYTLVKRELGKSTTLESPGNKIFHGKDVLKPARMFLLELTPP